MTFISSQNLRQNYIKNNQLLNQQSNVVNKNNYGMNKPNFTADEYLSTDQNENDNKKKKTLAYIAAGVILAAGLLIAILKMRRGGRPVKIETNPQNGIDTFTRQSPKDIPVAPSAPSKINTSVPDNIPQGIGDLNTEIPRPNVTDIPLAEIEVPPKSDNKPIEGASERITDKEIAADLSRAYDMLAAKYAEEPDLKEKHALIREVLPDLHETWKFKDFDVRKEVLMAITPENKDFIVKEAVPAIIRNEEALDLRHSMGDILTVLTPDNLDCMDKLAANAKKFRIESSTDTFLMLKALTKENKDFAFGELFPYLAENAEKYKTDRGMFMGVLLEVITPENKEFMLNEAIPALFNSKLKLEVSDVAEIAKHMNKDNLEGNINKINDIAENRDKYDIKNRFGMISVDKICQHLKKDEN